MKQQLKVARDCKGKPVSEVVETILSLRGIENTDFLNPSEDYIIPYSQMRNVEKAREIIFDKGIYDNKSIIVLADTDCDGVTSGVIITQYLREYTKNIECIINEGKQHGLSEDMLCRFDNADIVIIVDSLDSTIDNYKKLYDLGKQIVVLDHHKISNDIDYDKYVCLVSSQRDYDNPALSGAGVVWKFCKYCDEYYLTDYASDLVDLATCGIIADMMDMTSLENRAICNQGFCNINNLAIKKIVGGFEFNSTAVSFSIATLINAANRMNKNYLALDTFLCNDEIELKGLLKQLKACKDEQNKLVEKCIEDCTVKEYDNLVVIEIDTQSDIAGLLGNKIASKYLKPTLVLHKNNKEYYGSGRGYNTTDFMKVCELNNCWCAGHENAFGVKLNEENSDSVFKAISDSLVDELANTEKKIDISLDVTDITYDMIFAIKTINHISGENFKPITVTTTIDDYEIGNMSKGKHLVISSHGVSFIKWNWLGDFAKMEELAAFGVPIQLVGTLDSGYIGRNFMLKFIIDDIIIQD